MTVFRSIRIGVAVGFAVAVLCSASRAQAGFCGDDVGGVRIACDCGDVVASDTTLRADDPIIGKRCSHDGLVVRADSMAETLRLDLGGLALVGSGHGAGIIVQRGGSEGAVLVGGSPPRMAEIAGFDIGVLVPAPGAVRRIERIAVRANGHYGLLLRQAGAFVTDVVAERNSGHGIRILGTGGRFTGLRADENGGRGIIIESVGAILSDSSAILNGMAGIVSTAPRSILSNVRADGNGTDGVRTNGGRRSRVEGASATGNGRRQVDTNETRASLRPAR